MYGFSGSGNQINMIMLSKSPAMMVLNLAKGLSNPNRILQPKGTPYHIEKTG